MNVDIQQDPTWWFSRPQTMKMVEDLFKEHFKSSRQQISLTYSTNCYHNHGPGFKITISRSNLCHYFIESDYRDGGPELLKQSVQFDLANYHLRKAFPDIQFKIWDYINDINTVYLHGCLAFNLPTVKEKIYDPVTATFDLDAFKPWYDKKVEKLYQSARNLVAIYKEDIARIDEDFTGINCLSLDSTRDYIKVKMARTLKDTLLCYHVLLNCFSSEGQKDNNINKLDQQLPKELVFKIVNYLYDEPTLTKGMQWLKDQHTDVNINNLPCMLTAGDDIQEPLKKRIKYDMEKITIPEVELSDVFARLN